MFCAPLTTKNGAAVTACALKTKTIKVMSDQETSSEPKVASSETPSAPSPVAPTAAEPAAFPTFGTSRGSGLARGKRAASAAPAAATKNESAGEYKPTAIQVVTTEREYKNPFAPETPVVAEAAPVAASPVVTAAPASPVAIETPAEPQPAPVSAEPAPSAAPAPTEGSETKAELKILPPENRQQSAQSWESSSFPENKNASTGSRPTFRPERRESREPRENRENVAGRESFGEGRDRDFRRDNRGPREGRENREPRQPRDPREQREPRAPRENRGDFRDQREPRPLSTRPLPTPPAPQKKGFFGWLKNLFAGSPGAEKPAETANPQRRSDERPSEDGQRRHHHHRGGRGRGGYRGDQRGGPRENREDGSASGSGFESEGGERRFEGGHRRRRHRGGRGRGGFDNRQGGGDSRPDQGGSSGSASS